MNQLSHEKQKIIVLRSDGKAIISFIIRIAQRTNREQAMPYRMLGLVFFRIRNKEQSEELATTPTDKP